MTRASCNRILWNRQSSKTRANHPCLGCTEPGFPHHDLAKGSVFKTLKYLGYLPQELPAGASRLGYYATTSVKTAVQAAEHTLSMGNTLPETSK
jgi:hydrogenase small subunit